MELRRTHWIRYKNCRVDTSKSTRDRSRERMRDAAGKKKRREKEKRGEISKIMVGTFELLN